MARNCEAWRANDGSNTPEDYRPATTAWLLMSPTRYRSRSTVRRIKPFGWPMRVAISPAPPPALTSETWNGFERIRESAATRAPRTARPSRPRSPAFWFFTSPGPGPTMRLCQIASNRKIDVVDCAASTALHQWRSAAPSLRIRCEVRLQPLRPVTAIRNADLTSKPATPRRGIMVSLWA